MNSLSPKQQEIRNREQRILKLAREQILRSGYQGLTLESIASTLDVSRGTLYNHFPTREEILAALLCESFELRRDWFQRAASYPGQPRLRITALFAASELFARLHPIHSRLNQIVRSEFIWPQTSFERRSFAAGCQIQCDGIAAGIVRDAVAQGSLKLRDGQMPEDLVFGLSSLEEGTYSLLTGCDGSTVTGPQFSFATGRQNLQHLLDGFGWAPLSDEVEYASAGQTILADLFADEFRQLKKPW